MTENSLVPSTIGSVTTEDKSFVETNFVPSGITPHHFGWIDYVLFAGMLGVSVLIGIYFGFFGKRKQDNTKEYLMGGKTMSYFPVAMSITACHVSGITLLGIPSEVYQFGTQYAVIVFTSLFTCLITAYVYLPVFYDLQLTSTFEYLEIRFSKAVRLCASFVFTIALLTHTPIVVYVPALAFSQVTGFNVHLISPIICGICIFYTTIGGLKAVVWTDTIQFCVTVFALFAVLLLGIISMGGIGEIWRISSEGGRIVFFNMNPSPFVRTSFWGMSIGMTVTWISVLGINQGTVQRFLSVPTITEARKSLLVTGIGMVVVKYVSVFTGLIIYAKYHNCDPIATKAVTRSDQTLPYYVMEVAGHIPGLPGLFLAGLVSAALSTMSAGLNTAAGTIWTDFVSPWVPDTDNKEQIAAKVMKVTVVILGTICTVLVLIVEQLGEIFHMSTSMSGMTGGTIVGLFTLGMLVPWANSKGAIVGGTVGFIFMCFLVGGAEIHKMNDRIRHETLPTSTEDCPYPLNGTDSTRPTLPPLKPDEEPMLIFQVSFLYYALMGVFVVVGLGTLVSILTGGRRMENIDRKHFSPVVRRWLPEDKYTGIPLQVITKDSKENEKEIH